MKRLWFNVLIVIAIACTLETSAQQYIDYTLLSQQNYLNIAQQIDTTTFKSIRPWNKRNEIIANNSSKKVWKKKIFENDLIILTDSNNNYLRFNPILNLSIINDLNKTDSAFYIKNGDRLYTNARGLYVNSRLGKYIEINSWFTENQSFFPKYITLQAKQTEVINGQGRFKTFKKNGYDYSNASGNISFFINKFTIQAGSGKTHIGDGYRSMILSANAYNYPFLKLSYQSKYLFYQSQKSLISYIDPNRFLIKSSTEPLFSRTLLSYNLIGTQLFNSKLRFAIIDLQESDAAFSTGNNFNINSINIIPLLGSLIKNKFTNQIGSLIAINPIKQLTIYGQIKKNFNLNIGSASQIGFNYLNAAGIKNLNISMEYNFQSRNFKDIYHYNQSITHPSNMLHKESFYQIHYLLKNRLGVILRYQEIENFASIKTTYFTSQVFYLINHSNFLQVFVQYQVRGTNEMGLIKNNLLSAGISCKWNDVFQDF